ncbi:MAG: hypothetical protein AAFU77_06005 [Myxococcota bacterium]
MSKNIERLLKMRRRFEDNAIASAAEARNAADQCREGIEGLAAMRTSGDSIGTATARYCDELAGNARVALARHQSDEAAAQAVVVARRKDRMQMERLIERAADQARIAERRRERRELDEWTSGQWGRGSA